jgi:predicted Zn-dependent peptidase
MNIALEEFKTLIFENSVYSHSNKVLEKNLSSVSRENVLNYYNKILDPKNIIISVNGNVDSEKLIQNFGKIFVKKQQPVFNYSNFKITKLTSPKKVSKTMISLENSNFFFVVLF